MHTSKFASVSALGNHARHKAGVIELCETVTP
jgi:hypothetical protein